MPLEFSVNVDSGSIETALVSVFDPTRPIEISEFVINDSLELAFSFVDATGTPQFWSGDLAYDVRVALGEPGAVPSNGTFVLLDDGGASTPEFPTSTNAQALEDALNALNGDTGPDGAQVDVTRSYNGLYIVKRRVAGVYPLLMGDGALLSPEGTVVVDEITSGDASTKQVMAVRLVQQPFSINETWTQHLDPQTGTAIGYTGVLNLANLRMLQFLAGSAERTTHLEVEVTSPSGNRVTHAQQKVKIRSEVIHAAAIDPAHFPEESAKYVHNRYQVTALTGGGFTALDGVPTRNTPVGLLAAVEAMAGKVQHYRLEAGTDAEILPDVVRPLDYETGTNEKVWKRKDAVVPSQTAFIDLGTLTGGGTNLVSMPVEARILTVRTRINGTAPFTRYIELDKDSGQIGDIVFVQIEGNVSGTGTADVRMRHNGLYPTHYAMRLRALASTVHGWFAFIKREESSQPWYYIGGCESADYFSDPVFPISPSIPQKWYARLSSHLYELTEASTVYTDLKESNAFKLTLTANRTLGNPSNMQDAHMVTWFIVQDATGGRTLAYGSAFVSPPQVDTAPNAVTMFTGVCMGGKIYCLCTARQNLFDLPEDLFRVRKDGADYEILWNAYHDGADYKAIEGAGNAEAFRLRFGSDGTTDRLLAFDAASALTAADTISWTPAPLALSDLILPDGSTIRENANKVEIEGASGFETRIQKSGSAYYIEFDAANAAIIDTNGGELRLYQNGAPVASFAATRIGIETDVSPLSAAVYDLGRTQYNQSFRRLMLGAAGLPTAAQGATLFARDITDASSAEIASVDEDGVIIEHGGKVLSRTVTHGDTSSYNLYSTGSTEGLRIPFNTVCAFDIIITGINSGAGVAVAYRAEGLLVNDGGSMSFLGTPSVTAIDASTDADLSVSVVADDTNDRLQVQVSDSSGDAGQIKWKATCRLNMQQHD